MLAHGNSRAAMLNSSKLGIELSCISDALLVDSRDGKEIGIALILH